MSAWTETTKQSSMLRPTYLWQLSLQFFLILKSLRSTKYSKKRTLKVRSKNTRFLTSINLLLESDTMFMLTTLSFHPSKESEKLLNGTNMRMEKLPKLKISLEQREFMKVKSKKRKRPTLDTS